MKLRCVAIDDEPLALDLIREYASKLPAIELIKTFFDPLEGLEFLSTNKVDLIFQDIQMPDINGITLVRSLANKPMVIFTTAHRQFAVDSYELDAIDYVLKPIEYERFEKAVAKANEYYNYKTKEERNEVVDALFVRSEYKVVKINLRDIIYIESLDDYVKFHLLNAKPVLSLMSLKSVMEKLPFSRFRRVHRSYIVSIDSIKTIINRKIRLSETEIPVGDTYLSSVQELLKK